MANKQSTPSTTVEGGTLTVERTEKVWAVVVLDDPFTLMKYVVWVFRTYFKYSEEKSTKLMLQVHNNGRAVVARGPKPQAQRDARALQLYGLRAIITLAGED